MAERADKKAERMQKKTELCGILGKKEKDERRFWKKRRKETDKEWNEFIYGKGRSIRKRQKKMCQRFTTPTHGIIIIRK